MTVKRPTKKKNIEDTEEVEDSFRLKPLKKKTVVKEDVESDGTFKLKKTETEPKQDIEEEFQIGLKPVPKPIVSTSKDVEEEVKVGLKSKSKTKKSVEDETASLKVTIHEEEQEKEEQVTEKVSEENKMTVKRPTKKKNIEDAEEIEDSFRLKPLKKKTAVKEDVESDGTFKLKKTETEPKQDIEEEFQIGLKPVPKPIVSTSKDVEEEVKVGLKPKPKTKKSVVNENATLKVTVPTEETEKEGPVTEEVSEVNSLTIPRPRKKSVYRVEDIEEIENSFFVKPEPKQIDTESKIESDATFKLKEEPEKEPEQEDVEEKFQIGLKPRRKSSVSAPQDVEEDVRIGLKPKRKPKKIEEASEETTLILESSSDSSVPKTETLEEMRTRLSKSDVVSITDITKSKEKLCDSQQLDEISLAAKESLRFKIPAIPKIPSSAPSDVDAIQIKQAQSSTSEPLSPEETLPIDVNEGSEMFAVCSYVANSEEAMNLVEGERVYVLEWHNSDWWFVQKYLTEEKGWVPAQYLKDEPSYTHYVKNKLDEKIQQLPVFDSPKGDVKPVAPYFESKVTSLNAPDGTEVLFECKVVGHPRPIITWFRQTAPIKATPDFQMDYDENNVATLRIAEVFPEDAGTFTCVAKNSAGFASSSAELVIEAPLSDRGSDCTLTSRRSMSRESSLMDLLEAIPPTFSQRPKTKTVDEGTDVELECRLVAVPEPDVTWFHNGKRIHNTDRISVIAQSDVHLYCSIIQIKDVRMSDQGTYDIIARNREGEALNHVILHVKVMGANRKPSAYPKITTPLSNAIIPLGETTTFTACVAGHPPPTMKWYHNGLEIPKNAPNVTMTNEDGVCSLVIINTQSTDDGDYLLHAENEHGQAQTSAVLTVKTELNRFVTLLEDTQADDESDVVLTCWTKEPAEVNWYRNGKQLKTTKLVSIQSYKSEHKIIIRNFGPSKCGIYRCAFDKQSTECSLSIRVPLPEFISKISDIEVTEREPAQFVVEVSADAAKVTWHKDGEPVDVSKDRFEFVTQGKERRMIIRQSSIHDEGEYTCSLGEQECTAELVVIELAPEISMSLKNQTVHTGHKATFEIELTKGDAKVRWYKGTEEIQFSEHIQLAIDGKRQRLMIYDSQVEDASEYSCMIGDQKSVARLTVVAPEVDFLVRLPEITTGTLDQDVTFTVQLSKEEPEVSWAKNGEPIVESDRIKVVRQGKDRSLVITKAAMEDSAEYTCIIDTQKCTTVLIVEPPHFAPTIPRDQFQSEYWIQNGEDVTIEIPFNGYPSPNVEWTTNGKVVRKTKKAVSTITDTSMILTLKQVDDKVAGTYTCKLSNDCGEVSVDVTVKLIGKPESPSAPESLETADDSITIMWKSPSFDGGSTITNYIVEYQEKTSKKWTVFNKETIVTETTYRINQLTTNAEYRFRVTAVNVVGAGSPSAESALFKIAAPSIPEAPVIREPLTDVVSGINKNVALSCIITGVPKPTLRWFKDNVEIEPQSSSYENGCARLVLKSTTEDSAGHYSIQATNESGSCETKCDLLIQEIPKIVPAKKLKTHKLVVEKSWSLTVQITGLPRPDVLWTKNGKSLDGNAHYIIDEEIVSADMCNIKLSIISTERSDMANYTVTATNICGTATFDTNLKILDKPTKPQGPLVLRDITSNSAKLEWKPPLDDGGSEITQYDIEYCKNYTNEWTKVEEVIKITNYEVTELAEGDEYIFRVSAINEVGSSDHLESEPVVIQSLYRPPSAPQGPLEVSGLTDSSLVLGWKPPEDDGGSVLTEYLVERRETSKKAWQKVGTNDGKSTNFEVPGLKKGSSYSFRITAKNEFGYGPPFAPDDVITAGKRITAPSQPTNLNVADVTSRSVTLQWSPPVTTGGAELTSYIIEKRLSDADRWEKVATLDASITMHCIQNLREKSEFFFRVATENPMGISAPVETDKVSLKTHATPPSPPTAPLEVRPVGPNSIIVEWGIPESDGGAAIEGYIIAVREESKTMWIEVGHVGAEYTRLIVKDLQEGHKYFVRVFARNEVGLSDPLELEEPVKVIRPPDYLDTGATAEDDNDAPSVSFSTETLSSWMKEANMDADINSFSRSRLLRRDEYFFRVWYYSNQLFK